MYDPKGTPISSCAGVTVLTCTQPSIVMAQSKCQPHMDNSLSLPVAMTHMHKIMQLIYSQAMPAAALAGLVTGDTHLFGCATLCAAAGLLLWPWLGQGLWRLGHLGWLRQQCTHT